MESQETQAVQNDTTRDSRESPSYYERNDLRFSKFAIFVSILSLVLAFYSVLDSRKTAWDTAQLPYNRMLTLGTKVSSRAVNNGDEVRYGRAENGAVQKFIVFEIVNTGNADIGFREIGVTNEDDGESWSFVVDTTVEPISNTLVKTDPLDK